jgi:hypothetical protein
VQFGGLEPTQKTGREELHAPRPLSSESPRLDAVGTGRRCARTDAEIQMLRVGAQVEGGTAERRQALRAAARSSSWPDVQGLRALSLSVA